MNKFQTAYILIFFISLIGICGNFELEVPTALHCWVILIVSGFLTLGKVIYLERRKYESFKNCN